MNRLWEPESCTGTTEGIGVPYFSSLQPLVTPPCLQPGDKETVDMLREAPGEDECPFGPAPTTAAGPLRPGRGRAQRVHRRAAHPQRHRFARSPTRFDARKTRLDPVRTSSTAGMPSISGCAVRSRRHSSQNARPLAAWRRSEPPSPDDRPAMLRRNYQQNEAALPLSIWTGLRPL